MQIDVSVFDGIKIKTGKWPLFLSRWIWTFHVSRWIWTFHAMVTIFSWWCNLSRQRHICCCREDPEINLSICRDFAESFSEIILLHVRRSEEIRVVFDRYVENSLKLQTRYPWINGIALYNIESQMQHKSVTWISKISWLQSV